MTGRLTQLGRQLRKLRYIVGGSPSAAPATTLRRATQLARDLACENAGVDDAQAAFHDLSTRGIVEPALAERLSAWVASQTTSEREDVDRERATVIGRDLDTFLRSLELGAPAAELPFEGIVSAEDSAKPESTAGVAISGRILEVQVHAGAAVIAVDTQPIAMTRASGVSMTSFPLTAAPTSTPEITCAQTGVKVVWGPEALTIELAPDFRAVKVETGTP